MHVLLRIVAIAMAVALNAAPAGAAVVASASNGATISIPKQSFTKSAKVVVTGKNFDETIGIYLAYCVIPPKGEVPSPCGGGVNKLGTGEASYWISSNPPPYGVGLAIPFKPGGRFTEEVAVTRKIGKYDCRKVKCAITVRSDHLREGDRSHDIFIRITFK